MNLNIPKIGDKYGGLEVLAVEVCFVSCFRCKAFVVLENGATVLVFV